MIRLLMAVEGQAEETFAKRVLQPHLMARGVDLRVVLAWTRRLPTGGGFRGGVVSWGKLLGTIEPLLKDRGAWVTTFIDFYGLPADFPNLSQALSVPDAAERVASAEGHFAAALSNPRFIPHLTSHEFEALLFSAPAVVAEHFAIQRLDKHLQAMVQEAGGAELINHGPDSHPKARLRQLVQHYKASSDGPTIAAKIGLQAMRSACPHFDAWLARLETLPTS